MKHILFLCTGNSCRSALAEAIFNHFAPQGWKAISAGSHPVGYTHPNAIAVLKQHGIRTDYLASKSWDDLGVTPEIVITVCSSAAGETCPVYLNPALRSHWGLYDPAKATGSSEDIANVFEQTFELIQQGITFFLQHPIDGLSDTELQQLIDSVGQRYFEQ